MIKAHIEIGGQLEIIEVTKAETKSEAIEHIWDTYGIMTPIFELFEEEELIDGEINSEQ